MKPLLLCIPLLAALAAPAQRTEDFTIQLPEKAAATPPRYSQVDLLDARYDSSSLGMVQLGVFNARALVLPRPALQVQVQGLAQALGAPSGAGRAVLQLREFRFAEFTGGREDGWCYLRANLYAAVGDRYALLATLDSMVHIRAMDVTRGLFRRSSSVLVNFLAEGLARPAADSALLSWSDILHTDSLEKRRLPLYNNPQYRAGVYYTYASFASQEPDIAEPAPQFGKNGKLREIQIDMGAEKEVLKPEDCYALVHDGRIWVSTEFGYCLLEKAGDDFCFNGKLRRTMPAGKAFVNGFMFGAIIGGAISAGGEVLECRMRIDHRNGGFVPLKAAAAY